MYRTLLLSADSNVSDQVQTITIHADHIMFWPPNDLFSRRALWPVMPLIQSDL